MAEERKAAGEGPDRKKLLAVLVPAGGLALIIVLVAVVLALSDSAPDPSDRGKGTAGGGEPVDLTKMSDGSDPTADDPKLEPIGDQGLKYRDLKVGDGRTVAAGGRVKVHYTGWLTNGTVFDSSRRRREPSEFSLNGVV